MIKLLDMILLYGVFLLAANDWEDMSCSETNEVNTFNQLQNITTSDQNKASFSYCEEMCLPLDQQSMESDSCGNNTANYKMLEMKNNGLLNRHSTSQDSMMDEDIQDYSYVENSQKNSDGEVSFNDLVDSIEKQSEKLLQEAERILKEINEYSDGWYKKRFSGTREISNKYINIFDQSVLEKTIDYNSMGVEKLDLFFDIYFGENTPYLVFSESKFRNVLSMNDLEIFDILDVKDDIDYESLITNEFFNIQKYYKLIPELLALEHIRVIPQEKHRDILCYLRALNLYLTHCIKLDNVGHEFKDKVIIFIETIIKSGTSIRQCDIKSVQHIPLEINPCGSKHNDYFYVFAYNLDSLVRVNVLKGKISKKSQTKVLGYIKVAALYLLYNRLLLGNYLYYQKYEKERIEEFIEYISYQNNCVSCVMEECVSILCDKENIYEMNLI